VNNYEILVIFDTNGKPDTAESIIEAFSSEIQNSGGKINDTEDMGHKVFTREAKRHKQSGHYVKFWVELPSDFADSIQDHFRLNESVFRLMLTRDPGSFRPTDVPVEAEESTSEVAVGEAETATAES
jgi:ribosomal protein S6